MSKTKIPAEPANVIKRHRSISLRGGRFTLRDLRRLVAEATTDGYQDDSQVTVFHASSFLGVNTIYIAEKK